MKVKEITSVIEEFAPLSYQESYDNAGLIVGSPEQEVAKALLCVDITEEVMDEAEAIGADMVIAHHPIIFHPLKRFNDSTYIERVVARAIRRGTALYACHTNLDSTAGGMSWRLAEMLGITSLSVLEPTRPEHQDVGFGVIGSLPRPETTIGFLGRMKQQLGLKAVRYSNPVSETVSRIALCTGAGASLLDLVKRSGAQLYIAADFKYNDFLDASGLVTLADIGHFESEYCAIDLIFDVISKKLPNFALHKSVNSRNPINYLV